MMYIKENEDMKKRILSLLRRIENRVFYAIFQSTRVTNDNYGWRPSATNSATSNKKQSDSQKGS